MPATAVRMLASKSKSCRVLGLRLCVKRLFTSASLMPDRHRPRFIIGTGERMASPSEWSDGVFAGVVMVVSLSILQFKKK